jgi:hypothetical protein
MHALTSDAYNENGVSDGPWGLAGLAGGQSVL